MSFQCHAMKCDKSKTEDIGQMMLDIYGRLKEKKKDQVVHVNCCVN